MRILALALALATSQPLVPLAVQRTLAKKAGSLAYVPTRAPFRYVFLSYAWNAEARTLAVRLADERYAPNGRHTVAFTVRPFAGSCASGNTTSFHVDGNKVYSDGVVAWRCLPGVKLQAAGPNLPTVALAQVVASGKRVR